MTTLDIYMPDLKIYAVTGVGSWMYSMFTSIQLMIDPSDTWVPMLTVVGALGLAGGITWKVSQILNKVNNELERAHRERRMIARTLGIDLGDEE